MTTCTPEDNEKYEQKAKQLIYDLKPGESLSWGEAINAAKNLEELSD